MLIDVIDNEPRYFQNLVPNVNEYITWESVEYCVSNPQFYTVELIKDNLKSIIPTFKKQWIEKEIPERSFLFEKINQGYAFLINNYGFYNRATEKLLKDLADKFDILPDIHVYGGLEGSGSFAVHKDYPPNIIIQVDGETPWKVWKDTTQSATIDVVMKTGDVLFIPAQMYHVCEPNSARLSISIPLWPKENESVQQLDRTVYKINRTI